MNRSDYQLDVDISIVLFDVDNMVDITNKTMFSNNSILSPKVSSYGWTQVRIPIGTINSEKIINLPIEVGVGFVDLTT